jgi:hypothetical protein
MPSREKTERDEQQWQKEEVAAAEYKNEQGDRNADRQGSHGRFLELRTL